MPADDNFDADESAVVKCANLEVAVNRIGRKWEANGGVSSSVLSADGNYIVRVILPRSEAGRKGARANFSLTISVE